MKRNLKKQKGKVMSVQFVHDPDAAQKWIELCIQMAKESVLNHSKPE